MGRGFLVHAEAPAGRGGGAGSHRAALGYTPRRRRVTSPRAFDPSGPGRHSPTQWRSFLSQAPVGCLSASRLWVVAPHPDDETLGVGGLMAARARAGLEVHVLVVTAGERAYGASDPALAMRRRAELHAAMQCLGVAEAAVHWLGLPDGEVTAGEATLVEALIDRLRPGDTVLGPYSLDGHPDHEAAGRAARQAAESAGVDYRAYPIWAWLHTDRRELMRHGPERYPMEAADRRAKQMALSCYESQLSAAPRRKAIVPASALAYFAGDYEVLLR